MTFRTARIGPDLAKGPAAVGQTPVHVQDKYLGVIGQRR
jgi:hypothetical protein